MQASSNMPKAVRPKAATLPLPRSSGVLLHPTSLPSGRLDEEAYRFVDWLADAGQAWWQVLPLGPPGEGASPYSSPSAFAGSPELIAEPHSPVAPEQIADFRARQRYWIGGWERYAGREVVADQVRFDREWAALRAYAAERGVRVIGDLPIYVAPGGADHRAWPELFQEEEVAGAPPDKFSDTGQKWGNPPYDWPALQRRGYRWWVERLRRTAELVDVPRIDHFRGFVAYWSVPKREPDARRGRWRRGPRRAPFDAAREELGELPLIAENLGQITEAVERLRHELGLPGMAVLQLGFEPDEPESPHRLERHQPGDVVYTGTHDHNTVRGWWEAQDEEVHAAVRRELDRAAIRETEPWWALLRLAMSSPAAVSIVQAQDVLGLGSEARMNVPGRLTAANWTWQLERGALTEELAARLREATAASGRC